jgi:hypothetical protein
MRATFSLLTAAAIAVTPASSSAGIADFVKKIFKVAVDKEVTLKLPGVYPLGPTPLVLRSASLTVSTKGVVVSAKLTAAGVPLCTATLSIDSKGAALDCTASFGPFSAHLGGHLSFDFKDWGLDGHAALTILGRTLSGLYVELASTGFRATFSILGIDLSVGPITATDLYGAIKKAALSIIHPWELAKKAAKAVAAGAKRVGSAVAGAAGAAASAAKGAAKKVGRFLSSAASSIFGGGTSIMAQINELRKKKAAEKALREAEAHKRLKALCEAKAGKIIHEHGLDKAQSAADDYSMRAMLKAMGCDLSAEVRRIVAAIRAALKAVENVNAAVHKALLPTHAMEEAKKRGLAGFWRCAVRDKEPTCVELWPHLDRGLQAIAAEHGNKAPLKKKTRRRSRRTRRAASPEKPLLAGQSVQADLAEGGRVIGGELPLKVKLTRGLGFRKAPELSSPFVLPNDRYIEAGRRVKVLRLVGEAGKKGAFCEIEHAKQRGFIRCDGAYFSY